MEILYCPVVHWLVVALVVALLSSSAAALLFVAFLFRRTE